MEKGRSAVVIPFESLPALNATLNGTAAVLLVAGFALIRSGARRAHAVCMGAAFTVSVAFLVSYLAYHAKAGSVRFQGEGWIRPVYFGILLTHTVLAAAVPPLALVTLTRGLRDRIPSHRRIARWTLPVWLYVSVTGVVIYAMLYHVYRRG